MGRTVGFAVLAPLGEGLELAAAVPTGVFEIAGRAVDWGEVAADDAGTEVVADPDPAGTKGSAASDSPFGAAGICF